MSEPQVKALSQGPYRATESAFRAKELSRNLYKGSFDTFITSVGSFAKENSNNEKIMDLFKKIDEKGINLTDPKMDFNRIMLIPNKVFREFFTLDAINEFTSLTNSAKKVRIAQLLIDMNRTMKGEKARTRMRELYESGKFGRGGGGRKSKDPLNLQFSNPKTSSLPPNIKKQIKDIYSKAGSKKKAWETNKSDLSGIFKPMLERARESLKINPARSTRKNIKQRFADEARVYKLSKRTLPALKFLGANNKAAYQALKDFHLTHFPGRKRVDDEELAIFLVKTLGDLYSPHSHLDTDSNVHNWLVNFAAHTRRSRRGSGSNSIIKAEKLVGISVPETSSRYPLAAQEKAVQRFQKAKGKAGEEWTQQEEKRAADLVKLKAMAERAGFGLTQIPTQVPERERMEEG